MREIDAEAPVVWPAWCYSANTQESAIDVISRKGDLASEILPATSPSLIAQTGNITIHPVASSNSKSRARRKNPYTTSLTAASTGLHPTNLTAAASSGSSSAAAAAAAAAAAITANSEKLQQHLQLSSFLINKKMLSERMLLGFNNSSIDTTTTTTSATASNSNSSHSNSNNNNNNNNNNNKKNCDNSAILLYDRIIKNEAHIMDSTNLSSSATSLLKNGDLSAASNSSCSGASNSTTVNSNNIKKERLSPTANGDVQSSISRSRSATPSSFPGTPPQTLHTNDLVSQNILSSVHQRGNEFQARNYSDFMRSLAAKYNNSNPNDPSTARSLFFDQQKFPSSTSGKSANKDSPSPPEIKRSSLPTPPNVPFVSPLFPGLPFSTAVFPPLIDMSSTQALVTLARAAKEAEIQNILRSAQKRPSTIAAATVSAASLSPSLRSVLTPTPHQLAQFTTQSFMLPTQFHPPHRSPPTGPPTSASATTSRNSQSPHHPNYRNDPSSIGASISGNTKRSISPPLDLSSTHQSKRIKTETVSSPSASPSEIGHQSNISSDVKVEDVASPATGTRATVSPAATPVRLEFPRHCRAQTDEINSWTVDDVCNFVSSIDICAEYVEKFHDQCIDGSGLPLLTEDHLTNSLGMKLGPALKLRSVLTKKLGGPCPCVSCTTLLQQQSQHQQQLPHLTQPTTIPMLSIPSALLASTAASQSSGSSSASSTNAINNATTTTSSNSCGQPTASPNPLSSASATLTTGSSSSTTTTSNNPQPADSGS